MLNYKSSVILAPAYRQVHSHPLNILMEFGTRLCTIMQQKGITPTEMSRRSGLALAHISQLRHGQRNPSRKTLEKLSLVLEVSIDALLGAAPVPTQPATAYPTEIDSELSLLREEAKKYGIDSIRKLRAMLPIIYSDGKQKGEKK